ncbi:actin-like [Bolinopsis microptera]|uniref:actin-like n=1 Tax=Bolinopsis microptera TaxID=2820187 RepID=UPI003079C48C
MSDKSVVLDNGSYQIKAGFAQEDAPRSVIPTVLGHYKQAFTAEDEARYYVGSDAQSKREALSLQSPFSGGTVTNWDTMQKIWDHTFHNDLRLEPKETKMFMIDPPLNPHSNRETMAQLIFETFKFSSLYVITSAVPTLYASGRSTGVVVDSGYDVTRVVPVCEGFVMTDEIKQVELAGRAVTNNMTNLIWESTGNNPPEAYTFREIKEKFCYVAEDYDLELQKAGSSDFCKSEYKLPDGTEVSLRNERFDCTEILFQPYLGGHDCAGIHEICHQSISKCDADILEELYSNIVLAGSTTLFPGMAQRLRREITALAPAHTKVKMSEDPKGNLATWLGGSIMASMTSADQWITKEEYEEQGSKVVFQKCPQ